MSERTWLETTSCATKFSDDGRLRTTNATQTARTTIASAAAAMDQRHQLCLNGGSFASRRTAERRRFSKLAEGVKRSDASFIDDERARISSRACAHDLH